MKEVILYTDGACSGNPGPGGWACVLKYGEYTKELSGYAGDTTNNRMEMTAAIEGLRALKERCAVRIHSDSSYLINGFEKRWIYAWMKNGWQTSAKKPVENKDLWQELIRLSGQYDVKWIKVRGHSDVELNERCDELARAAIKAGVAKAPDAADKAPRPQKQPIDKTGEMD